MTLLRLTPEYDDAVIELWREPSGRNSLDCESDLPVSCAGQQPRSGRISKVFGSLAGVAKAHGEIFSGLPENGIAIMNADNNDWLNWQSV